MRLLTRLFPIILLFLASCGPDLPDHVPPEKTFPPPAVKEEARICVIGDWGSGQIEQWQVAQGIEKVAKRLGGFHAGLSMGDNFYPNGVDSVEDSTWRVYFEEVYDTPHISQLCWYSILGNHDYSGNAQAQIDYSVVSNGRWHLPHPWYQHDFVGSDGQTVLTIIGVDTNDGDCDWQAQIDWVRENMVGWKKTVHPLVAFGHHPIYSDGKHDASQVVIDELYPLLLEAGIDLYLCGHDHNGQMILEDGIGHAVIGHSGKTLHPVNKPKEHLLYSVEDYGFGVLYATRESLKLEFRDRHGKLNYTWASD
ncbi:MAG: metallophosphoesterase [Planctomycetota bacterium]|jgi:acid phosphatase/tartrate-resistant acid phosphatase type 5